MLYYNYDKLKLISANIKEILVDLDNKFFIILNKYSSSACHRYKQPSVDDIKIFYEARKEQIIHILSDLNKITIGK